MKKCAIPGCENNISDLLSEDGLCMACIMRKEKSRHVKGKLPSESLCWHCKNAVPNYSGRGCNWSRFFKPVPGWDAPANFHQSHDRMTTGYKVNACPMFERG